jgi:omega-amidase
MAARSCVASLVVCLSLLQEMFNCPYSNASFNPYSEALPAAGASASSISASTSPTAAFMSALAKQHGIYLIAGSIPEKAQPEKGQPKHAKSGLAHHLYNTCLVFSPAGDVIAKHRKVHLFDIDVPGKMTFKESDTLSAGNQATLFDTPWARVGLGICYDIRFNDYATVLTNKGATMLIYPGAFNTTTGPLHWELLQRARAVDNQLWVLTCSPARSPDPTAYQAWGHSSAISPWGRVVATTEHQPAVVIAEVDVKEVSEMRASIPVLSQKRSDLYQLTYSTKL